MIFFEGFDQLYSVEELSLEQAKLLLAQQALEPSVAKQFLEQAFNRDQLVESVTNL